MEGKAEGFQVAAKNGRYGPDYDKLIVLDGKKHADDYGCVHVGEALPSGLFGGYYVTGHNGIYLGRKPGPVSAIRAIILSIK